MTSSGARQDETRVPSESWITNSLDDRAVRIRNAKADVADVVKAFKKKWLGRGPGSVHVTLEGVLVVVRCLEILAKNERAILRSGTCHAPDRERMRAFRVTCFEGGKRQLALDLEDVLHTKVLDVSYSLFLDADECVFLIRLQKEFGGEHPHSNGLSMSPKQEEQALEQGKQCQPDSCDRKGSRIE